MLKNLKQIDYILLPITLLLLILGIVILASVSAPFAQEKFGSTFYFLKHQLLFGLLPGITLAFLVFKIKLSFLKKIAPVLLLINLILLGMVFLPIIGLKAGGASRWVNFGIFSLQPSEILKLTFILYLASWLSSRRESETRKFSQTFIAFLIILGVIGLLLIFQPDISTLGIIVFIAILMYFSIRTPLWHSILIVMAGLASLFAIINLAPYRSNRLLVFFNPELDPMGIGYQIKQALIAVGSGGISGVGLGMSTQKFGFLPQSISDSIFAVFSEETGFIGAFLLTFLFLIFLLRGFKIAKECKDSFSQLMAIGITAWIVLQAFVNIGAMVGLLPLAGIPLPFFSYGGTALIVELVGVGILLNISKHHL